MKHSVSRSRSSVQPALLLAFTVVLSIVSAWLFMQRSLWLPRLASVHGADMDREFMVTLAITGLMFVAVQVSLGVLAFRFAAHRNPTPRRPGTTFENRFSIAAAAIVFLVDISLFATGEASIRRVSGVDVDNATVVEVNGEQFAWNFRYPGPDGEFGRVDPMLIDGALNPVGLDMNDPASADDIVRINQMHVPIGRPVRAIVHAKDVIHSFSVPNLRVKQDAVPGMLIEVNFEPSETGQFEIVCNQLCGWGHYRMRAFLTVESQAEFDEWLVDVSAGN